MNINKFLKIIVCATLLFGLSSCSSDNDTFGVSTLTNYPVLALKGNNPELVKMGTTYTDPGVDATENGQKIDYASAYKGVYRGATTLNLAVSDKYTATYSAVNKDGFKASTSRNIWVYNTGNFVDSIEGLYVSRVVRRPGQGVVPATADLKYVLIWKNADGTYGVSDAIGGYYAIGRSYGDGYASTGLKLNYAAGVATVADQPDGVGAFGGNIVVSGIVVDPVNRKITLPSTWDSGFTFVVTLTQVN